jgi:hypothetical protein
MANVAVRARTVRAVVLVGVTGLTLAASACGGPSGATARGSTSASSSRDPVAWSACMRSHGVPSFPDPGADARVAIPSTIGVGAPTVRAAFSACRRLAPSGSPLSGQGDTTEQNRLLAFAKCMRTHGVPAFPDPREVNGRAATRVTAGAIDPNSPIVTAAMRACQSKLGTREPAAPRSSSKAPRAQRQATASDGPNSDRRS